MGQPQSTDTGVVMDTPKSYPNNQPRPAKPALKKPPPNMGSFFDAQMAAPMPHAQARKPNRPKDDFNFYFEVASVTPQPVTNTKSRSQNSNSSLKTSSKKSSSLYPSSTQLSQKKKGTPTSSSASSIASSTLPGDLNESSIKNSKTETKTSNYLVIQNRKYWKGQGSQNFILPYDDDESDRLMTLHYILKSTFQGNFTAPVYPLLEQNVRRAKALDIGCGAGTWILEMATEFPNAEFYGVDECPMFPTHIKPGNSHFLAHNVLKGLPYEDKTFDFVYMRNMILYFTPEELSSLLMEISRVMKPGAYFEIIDTNYTVRHAGPITSKVINTDLKSLLYAGSLATKATQHDSTTSHPIFSYLTLATSPQKPATSFIGSFIDISQEHATLPLGWGGNQISTLHAKNFMGFLTGLQSKNQEIQVPMNKHMIDDVMDECERYKSYLDWFSCYARKPPMDDEHIDQSTLDSIHEFVEGFVDV
ncbi:S-adenosyl-L-methionine-dependent methyltransferase [Gilbertella persicaria]|uniref:S-adenosyl-L-methionine-dependent methyltransferase n=1 Tax=Gilbertella persicaria TaxID=101096 RepID=UPI00221E4E55|nr:S-adenosyl-L-methionine-dependent methyltransferase [Gilbertella persicaria]KAI8076439.1 S-adenosyl-L-methionine-dependent methyltransferase [Gilbertella persicaria]